MNAVFKFHYCRPKPSSVSWFICRGGCSMVLGERTPCDCSKRLSTGRYHSCWAGLWLEDSRRWQCRTCSFRSGCLAWWLPSAVTIATKESLCRMYVSLARSGIRLSRLLWRSILFSSKPLFLFSACLVRKRLWTDGSIQATRMALSRMLVSFFCLPISPRYVYTRSLLMAQII